MTERNCEYCGAEFIPKTPKARFCSFKCFGHAIAKEKHVGHDCLLCHFNAGVGVNMSARLVNKKPPTVSTWRKARGLKMQPKYLLPLQVKAQRVIAEHYEEELARWIAHANKHSWADHLEARRAYNRAKYYEKHQDNKARSRNKARRTWERRKNDPKWREVRRIGAAEYRAKNRDKTRLANARWRQNNPDKYIECKRRQRANPVFRAMRNIRKRLREALKGKRGCPSIVGCKRIDFMRHIESKFKKGMHWNNYGTHWHIDHIVPLSRFDLSDPYQMKMANHWTNLQPLEALRNMEKSDRIEGNMQPFLPL